MPAVHPTPMLDIETIIEVIMADDQLLQYVMRTVKSHFKRATVPGPAAFVQAIDKSIDQALEDVRVVDILRSIISSLRTDASNDADAEMHGRVDVSDQFVPPFSSSEPQAAQNSSPKRLLKLLNRSKPAALDEVEQRGSLEIEIEPRHEESFRTTGSSAAPSVAESEASTVRMSHTGPLRDGEGGSLSDEDMQHMRAFSASPEDGDDVRSWERQVLASLRSDSLMEGEDQDHEDHEEAPEDHVPVPPAPSISLSALYHSPTSTGAGQPLFFDPQAYSKALDSPNALKRVHFPAGEAVVREVFYRDKTSAEDKGALFYSHEEEDRFTEAQNREFQRAETMGLSWYDYMQSRPVEELMALEAYDEEAEAEDLAAYDEGGYLQHSSYEEDFYMSNSYSSSEHSPGHGQQHHHFPQTTYPHAHHHHSGSSEQSVDLSGDDEAEPQSQSSSNDRAQALLQSAHPRAEHPRYADPGDDFDFEHEGDDNDGDMAFDNLQECSDDEDDDDDEGEGEVKVCIEGVVHMV